MRSNWRLVLGSLLVTFCGLEIFFRISPSLDEYTNNAYGYLQIRGDKRTRVPRHSYQDIFPVQFDRRGYYQKSAGAIDYHSNQYGARWIENANQPLAAKNLVLLGDSFTYGFGLRYEDTFAFKVGNLLRAHTDLQLFNFGEPGANSRTVAHIYGSQKVPQPTSVIYFLNLNDLVEFPTNYVIHSPVADGRLNHSRFLAFLVKRLEAVFGRKQRLRELTSPSVAEKPFFASNMKAIVALNARALKDGTHLHVVILPDLIELHSDAFRPIYDLIGQKLSAEKIDYFDLTRDLGGYADSDLWIMPFDQHPNELAAQIFADRLAPWMQSLPELK